MAQASDNDDIQTSRNPFQKLKKLLSNLRTPRSRSTSPATLQSSVSFTGGNIHHAHSTLEPGSPPAKYLLLGVSHSGQLLDIPTQTTNNIGYITCQCKPKRQIGNHKKTIAFIPSAHPPRLSRKEHYVDSPFVFPQLTPGQKSTSKSYPMFFKLPPAYADNTLLVEEHAAELKSIVLARLEELTDYVDQDEIDNVYSELFAPSRVSPYNEPNTQPLEDSNYSESDSNSETESESPISRDPSPSSPEPVSSKLGVLIYAHHNHNLKTFTRAELSEVFKTLPHDVQTEVRRLLTSARPAPAGIYLVNSKQRDTTKVYSIPLGAMRLLSGKLFYKTVTRNDLTYTLASLSEMKPHLKQYITKLVGHIDFFNRLKSVILTSNNPNHRESKSKQSKAVAKSRDLKKSKSSRTKKRHRSQSDSSKSTSPSSRSVSPEPTKDYKANSILRKQTYRPKF